MSTATIWIRFRQPGFHSWPGGPDYLSYKHRHLFHVEVSMPAIVNDERSVEFHELLEFARNAFMYVARTGTNNDFGDKSCETIARDVGEHLVGKYNRAATVTVSEDGECGATVTVRMSDLY